MTRKDYIKIAAALAASRPSSEVGDVPVPIMGGGSTSLYEQWAADTVAIADVLEADSPRFDRQRFLFAAAGGEEVSA